MSARYLTAHEAAAELAISVPTLYAYVSRGLIRSEETGGSKRTRRYHAEDIARLKQRQQQRRDPQAAVETALHWGAPVLESALALIADGKLLYRGQDATTLAKTYTIEQVAALLWLDDVAETATLFGPDRSALADLALVRTDITELSPFERLSVLVPLAAAHDLAAYDLQPGAVARTGTRILHLFTETITGEPVGVNSIALSLAQHWAPDDGNAARVINAALILCADHELNVSAFTARCVASAGATPYAAVQAGLAALGGFRHGGQTERAVQLLQDIGSPGGVRSVLATYGRRGEPIPGFDHVLFPNGDPRATALLDLLAQTYPTSPAVALVQALIEHRSVTTNKQPNIDLALATLTRTFDLPPGAGLALFALGRTVGWIAHAIEQYAANQLIRPRARYTGKQPDN